MRIIASTSNLLIHRDRILNISYLFMKNIVLPFFVLATPLIEIINPFD